MSKKRNLLILIPVSLTEHVFDIILLDKKYPHLTKDDEKLGKIPFAFISVLFGGDRVARVILHCDANSFYCSCELCYRPELRHLPVAVGGDVEARHGIILTANPLAKKKFGVKTGEALWQARHKCPQLVILPADYSLYIHFSKQMRSIVEEYSDRVEAFGLDENWIDISGPRVTLDDGERIAQEIRRRVKEELGITVSIGVADNKIFAKLGSDMKKPDAVTVIRPNDFRETVWKLPAGDLLYVGPATRKKLAAVGILSIGDLANCDARILSTMLGKNGLILKLYAMGADQTPVMPVGAETAIKSIGNSLTAPRDIETFADAKCVIYLLCESVAARMREHGFRSRCISLSVRSTELVCNSCQCTIDTATNLTGEIAETAYRLFTTRFADRLPLRSLGVSCGRLSPDTAPVQLDMFGDNERRLRVEDLERAVDGLRGRFGHQVVQRGIVLFDRKFSEVNPREEHTIHPVPLYTG